MISRNHQQDNVRTHVRCSGYFETTLFKAVEHLSLWLRAKTDENLSANFTVTVAALLDHEVRLYYTELFNVYLLPTDKLNFSGECLLQVTPNELSLLDVQQPRTVLALWPLSTIRQYGNPNDENFTFIAGR